MIPKGRDKECDVSLGELAPVVSNADNSEQVKLVMGHFHKFKYRSVLQKVQYSTVELEMLYKVTQQNSSYSTQSREKIYR